MKNPELFHKTVGILVKAYQNDTLEYCACNACAVGNIVAANIGSKIIRSVDEFGYASFTNDGLYSGNWATPIQYGKGSSHVMPELMNEEANEQIEATGYSVYEIADIEKAFCIGTNPIETSSDINFNGLMAVVDCLMQIHEATTEEAEQAKELFVKA